MSISLAQGLDVQDPELAPVAAGLIGQPIRLITSLGGGRNSRIYQAVGEDGTCYCLKRYFRHRLDGRARLETEFGVMHWLRAHGVEPIPRALGADETLGLAVYEWIEGDPVPPATVSEADVQAGVEFLAQLKALRGVQGSQDVAGASEACLSGEAAIRHIERRVDRLAALPREAPGVRDCHAFLAQELAPALRDTVTWAKKAFECAAIPWETELDRMAQTLSPSDFGFHNALRRPDGRLVYLDFEYFGWDDPAKMLADFLLHPGMELSEPLKRQFAAGVLRNFAELKSLPERTVVMHRLCGLKWCTILLNEFVPEHLARRRFADGADTLDDQVLAVQLGKAKQMLARAMKSDHGLSFSG